MPYLQSLLVSGPHSPFQILADQNKTGRKKKTKKEEVLTDFCMNLPRREESNAVLCMLTRYFWTSNEHMPQSGPHSALHSILFGLHTANSIVRKIHFDPRPDSI